LSRSPRLNAGLIILINLKGYLIENNRIVLFKKVSLHMSLYASPDSDIPGDGTNPSLVVGFWNGS
jgi:hypothetical protein